MRSALRSESVALARWPVAWLLCNSKFKPRIGFLRNLTVPE